MSHIHGLIFFLISNTLIDSVVICEMGAELLSDQGTVELHVALNPDKVKRGWWRLNTAAAKHLATHYQMILNNFLKLVLATTISSVWEASKAYVRGKVIAHS